MSRHCQGKDVHLRIKTPKIIRLRLNMKRSVVAVKGCIQTLVARTVTQSLIRLQRSWFRWDQHKICLKTGLSLALRAQPVN
jgi:hypothetical protein